MKNISSKSSLSRFALAFASGTRDQKTFLYTPSLELPKWGTLFFAPEDSSTSFANGLSLPISAAVMLSTKAEKPSLYPINSKPNSVRIDPFETFITKSATGADQKKADSERVNIDMDFVTTFPYRYGYLNDLHQDGSPIILCDNSKFIDLLHGSRIIFPAEVILPNSPLAAKVYKEYLAEKCLHLANLKDEDARDDLRIMTNSEEGKILLRDLKVELQNCEPNLLEHLAHLIHPFTKPPSTQTAAIDSVQLSKNPYMRQRE